MAERVLNTELATLIRDSTDDSKLLYELNVFVNNNGSKACLDVFELLADISFTEQEAHEHWRKLISHVDEISEAIERPINLVAAICDYFAGKNHVILLPKITTMDHFERLVNDSTYDRLTGLLNRNYFHDILIQQLAVAKRQEMEFSLLFIDIDDFKQINDNYGHQVGDRVLEEISALVTDCIRLSDFALRYGGEEFVVLMPNTSCNQSLILGNRIREKIQQHKLVVNEQTISITVSGGIASYPSHAKEVEELIYFADSALYFAKGAGKNNISLFKDENRRYLRIPLSEQVQIKELGFSEAHSNLAMSKDIAIGGILFESKQNYQIGSQLQMRVKINVQKPILLIGVVVRIQNKAENCYEVGVALSFEEMEKVAKTEISQLLATNHQGTKTT
jgi:diguanylate cyclase (GGDEF)-like protein